MLKAFIDNGVSESSFAGSTGYGYDDRGREVLDEVTAEIFGAEDALIRHSFASGTHTLAVMLFGVLRPGDKVLSATGVPYDTIHSVIGLSGEGMGSLKDFGIEFEIIDLLEKINKEYKDEKVIALGPMPARVSKINNKFRYRLIIKCKNSKRFRSMISELLIKFAKDKKYNDVTLTVDINPESLV